MPTMEQFLIKAICNDNNNPLFILGSIYTSNASGAEQMLKQIIYIKLYWVNNPNWPGGGTSWLFTSMAKDLNSG